MCTLRARGNNAPSRRVRTNDYLLNRESRTGIRPQIACRQRRCNPSRDSRRLHRYRGEPSRGLHSTKALRLDLTAKLTIKFLCSFSGENLFDARSYFWIDSAAPASTKMIERVPRSARYRVDEMGRFDEAKVPLSGIVCSLENYS